MSRKPQHHRKSKGHGGKSQNQATANIQGGVRQGVSAPAAKETSTDHVVLIPRDGFFIKDGRSWQTSARASVVDWPWPTTIRGALTTFSGKAVEHENGRRFGPQDWKKHQEGIVIGTTMALRRMLGNDKWSCMWPVPADALWLEGDAPVLRLKPRRPQTSTLGRAAHAGHAEAREALWVPQVGGKAKVRRGPRWFDDAALVAWLSSNRSEVPSLDRSPFMKRRFQAHVGIHPDTLTNDDGILYAHDVIETLERVPGKGDDGDEIAEWAVGVEMTWPASQLQYDIARFGSDGRIAWVKTGKGRLFDMPAAVQEGFPSPGLRLMVVTPAGFSGGWLPDGFAPVRNDDGEWEFRGRLRRSDETDLILRAAFVSRPMHISGWDMVAGGPRRTARLVPPGAVYFFERADGGDITAEDAKALWLAALGERTNEGFGRVVPGVWNPRETD